MSSFIEQNLTGLLPVIFYLAIFLIVYIETAIIFAFFIPGDTLLFTVGLVVASSGQLNIYLASSLIAFAAFLGDQTAYAIGRKKGLSYITARNSVGLNLLLTRAENFYKQYGVSTIALSRFYPWLRTLTPFLAGVGKMNYSLFVAVNALSAIGWGFGITFLGYFANSIPALENSSRQIAIFFILLTVVVALRHYLHGRRNFSNR